MLDGMTNIKASEVLKELKDYTEDLPHYSPDEVAEALEMANKALEQQPRDCKTCKHSDSGNCAGTEECHECMWESKYEQESSEDCISRAEFRRVLADEVFELMKLHTVNPEDNPKAEAMAHGVNWSLNTLMEMPPVTPQRPKGKWKMNSDYPDRLICDKCNAQFDVWHWESKQMHFCPNCGAEMEVDHG